MEEFNRKPEMVIIAGPNGSGKTTITQKFLHHEWSEGILYINPDQIAKDKFGDWNSQSAVFNAANFSTELRYECINKLKSFVFETVLSSDEKIDFIIKAKEKGFFIRVFFIATENPAINASRIAKRVMEGGHDVPISKIISRYYKSISNCEIIARIVDRLYVYDNSIDNRDASPLFRLSNGEIGKIYVEDIPKWAKNILPKY